MRYVVLFGLCLGAGLAYVHRGCLSVVESTVRGELGISPRGTAALFRAAQAIAMLEGRSFILPDDIKRLVHPVFEHRLVMGPSNARGRAHGVADAKTVLSDIVAQIPIPA